MSLLQTPPVVPSFYRHSGKVPTVAGVVALVTAVGLGVVLGLLYGAVVLWIHLIPYVKLSLLLDFCAVVGFSFVFGLVPTWILQKLKARSTAAAIGASLTACLAGYYCAWIGWVWAFLVYQGDKTPLAIVRPDLLSSFAAWCFQNGTWFLLDDLKPKGWFLAAIWLLELGTIVGIACTVARRRMSKTVFCETCNAWGTDRELMKTGAVASDVLQKEIAAGNIEAFAGSPRYSAMDKQWLIVSLEGCANCDNLQTLTLKHCQENRDKKGNVSVKIKVLVRRLMLAPEQTVRLAMIAAEQAAPGAPSRGATA